MKLRLPFLSARSSRNSIRLSGNFDLLAKIYIPEDQDVGKFINDNVLDIQGIARSLTTMTFTAF